MTTWHKKCGDDTSRPGSKICIYAYTLDIPHSDALPYHFYTWRSFSFSLVRVPSKREPNEVPRLSLSMDVKIWIIHHPSSSIYIRARPTAKCSNHLRFTWLSGLLQHEEFMHLQLRHFLAAIMISISVVSPVIFLDGVHRGPTRRHGRCLKILQGLACSNCPASRAWWLHPRNML